MLLSQGHGAPGSHGGCLGVRASRFAGIICIAAFVAVWGWVSPRSALGGSGDTRPTRENGKAPFLGLQAVLMGPATTATTAGSWKSPYETESNDVDDPVAENPVSMLALGTVPADLVSARSTAMQQAITEQSAGGMNPQLKSLPHDKQPIRELYTFGAPATNVNGVYDAQSPGGCFAGLRVATQTRSLAPDGTFKKESDPVPSLLDFAYKHALMDFWEARADTMTNVEFTNCSHYKQDPARLKDTPKWDNLWWLNGHMMYPSVLWSNAAAHPNTPLFVGAPDNLPLLTKRATRRRLENKEFGMFGRTSDFYHLAKHEKVERAALISHLTFLNYFKSQQIGIDAPLMGWTMVARANGATDEGLASGMLGMSTRFAVAGSHAADLLQTVNTYVDGFGDRLLLLQNKETLECLLTFEGSSMTDIKDWLSNLNFFPTDFCAFGQTHKGFRAKLYRMVAAIDYRQSIRRKMKNCAGVTVSGHSLGGAQAELFAGCANNPRGPEQVGHMDHRLTSIPKGTPRKMASWYSDHAPGNFLQNKVNKWCIDVDGMGKTSYRSRVIMYPCEFPSNNWDGDQKWSLNEEGFIVNALSGKCMDKNVSNNALVQQACQFGSADTLQKWEITEEGFLRNKKNGQCVDGDMTLMTCPFTDQRWEIRPSGHVVNKLSGLCLDVEGAPGVKDGSKLLLFTCEDHSDSDQRWELLANGMLRNKLSGKCVAKKITPKTATRPSLILGPCDGAAKDITTWQHTSEGYLMNTESARCMNVEGLPGVEDGLEINMWACQHVGILTSGRWILDKRGFIINVGLDAAAIRHSHKASIETSMYRCIEVYGEPVHDKEKLLDGARLWLDFCKINSDQKWQITEKGYIRNVIGGQKCLGVVNKKHWVNPEVPALWIDNCIDPDDPAMYVEMKWRKKSNGELRNIFSRKCLAWSSHEKSTANHGLTKSERVVSPMQCSDPQAVTKWDFTPNGTVISRSSGKCLDLGGPPTEGNPPLAMQLCEAGKESQQWELLPNGFLKNKLRSMCAGNFIDAAEPDHMISILKDCPTGSEQQWDMYPDGQIQNKASGHCLDAPKSIQNAPDFQLTVSRCDPGRAEQKWDKIPTPMVSVD